MSQAYLLRRRSCRGSNAHYTTWIPRGVTKIDISPDVGSISIESIQSVEGANSQLRGHSKSFPLSWYCDVYRNNKYKSITSAKTGQLQLDSIHSRRAD